MKIIRTKTEIGKSLQSAVKKLEENTKVGKVGWFENAKYDSGVRVAKIAAIQDRGLSEKNIPKRPMLEPTVAREQQNWKRIFLMETRKLLKDEIGISHILERLVNRAAGDVKKTISQIIEPPLKPATIRARTRKYKDKKITDTLSKPLIETGILLSTVTGIVIEESSD